MSKTRLSVFGSVVVTASLLPKAAAACPSCFSATEQHVLRTYYLTAALMSVLPLAIVGGVTTWLYFVWRRGALPGSDS